MKSNRMFGILCILLEKEKVTARELADYFEVSVRTVHRDLLDLSSAGFPVASRQGIGGGVFLLPHFRFNRSALTKEDMDIILAGIQGVSSIDDSGKIKTLLAKLHFDQGDKMLLENDIIIDFNSWNQNSTIVKKVKTIRNAIAGKRLLEMEYYSSSGCCHRCIEPYKLIFKQENWYLFGYCRYKEAFRIFKVNRMTQLHISGEIFMVREEDTIPALQSNFVNDRGICITVRMDQSLEFLAVDFFGPENIRTVDGNLYADFQTEHSEWVISTFAGFGDKAEIISPSYMRERMKNYLEQTIKQYQ